MINQNRNRDATRISAADTVIISVGYRSENKLYEELKDSANVHLIGDAEKPAKILTAVAAATKCALEI